MVPAVNDRLKVIFSCWLDGQLGINIRHYRVTAVGGVGIEEPAIASFFFLDVDDLYADLITEEAFFLGVSVRNITQVPLRAAGVSDNPAINGTPSGDPLPGQCTGIITLTSPYAGRANRGRMYIPFPAEVDSAADHLPTDDYVERLQALGTYMAQPVVAGAAGDTVSLQPIIRHAGGGDADVTGFVARQAWATQRRRGSYGAANPKAIAV